jgi:peptidoglycan/xylan/chitin deacetylase (PgdA/CDA1 family)
VATLFFHGPRRYLRRRVVALTFDDGPSQWTPRVLDALRDHDARGTFFVLGTAAGSHPDVLKRAVSEGHELGNHLYSHRDPLELDEGELERELQRTAEAVQAAAGVRPRLVRPPYGGDRERVARVADRIGLGPTILSSVDPEDWLESAGAAIASRVLEAVRPGSIVDLHDGLPETNRGHPTREPTVAALHQILPELARRRYRCVTVSELLSL